MDIKRHYRPTKVKKYEARWYVQGRLKCRFFATEAEREKFIEDFSKQLERNGSELLLGFDPAKMRRWQEASRLAPDADPVEVMRFWLASNRPNLTPMPLADAVPAYLESLVKMERAEDYRRHMKAHLSDFAEVMSARRNVHEISPQEIATYIFDKPYAAVTKRHYKRSIGAAYVWWIEQGWAIENPAAKVRTPEVVTAEPGILTVPEMRKLFAVNEKVDPEICGLLALGAFAGMRTSAISKVDYHEIDFTQSGILTPAEKTKKKRRQWIEDLPDNLWAWLERTPPSAFEMDHRQFLHRRSDALKRAGLLIEADDIAYENRKRKQRGEPQRQGRGSDERKGRGANPSSEAINCRPKCPPKNAFRHSFVSYHVALHRNPGKTALIISHRNQQVLFQHYLGIATKKDAEDYFKIVPTRKTRQR